MKEKKRVRESLHTSTVKITQKMRERERERERERKREREREKERERERYLFIFIKQFQIKTSLFQFFLRKHLLRKDFGSPNRFSKVHLEYLSIKTAHGFYEKINYLLWENLFLKDTFLVVKTECMLLFSAPLYDIISFSFTYRVSAI